MKDTDQSMPFLFLKFLKEEQFRITITCIMDLDSGQIQGVL